MWEFLSAWSEVYGTEENTSLLKAMGHSLDAARTNVRRFAGDVGKVCGVQPGTYQLSCSRPPPAVTSSTLGLCQLQLLSG